MLRSTLPLFLLACPVWAQMPEARSAFADYQTHKAEVDSLMAEMRGNREQARELSAKMAEPRKKMTAALEKFGAAFAKTDWSAWDVAKDQEALEQGLLYVGRTAAEHGKPKDSIRALTMLLEKMPKSKQAGAARRQLPMAYVAAGQPDQGIAFLQQTIADASDREKAQLQLSLGDIHAIAGDYEQARTCYEAANESADENTKRYVTLRLELVGKPAPEIASDTWVGGTAKPLSAHKGQVVVVDFWATWCGPCRQVMPALSKLYDEHKDQGLAVLGVTKYYNRGYLPANKEQMQTGGKSVQGIAEDAFLEHVTDFRTNTGISYPFVVAEDAHFKSYHVQGIPTVAVVDTSGKVALVVVGSGSEPMIQAIVRRELGNKGGSAKPGN